MSQLPFASGALDRILDLIGVVLGLTGLGSGLGVTIAVLERRNLSGVERLGFQGTAVGFLLGALAVIGVFVFRA